MMEHTRESEEGRSLFKASLVYMMNSRTAWAIQRVPDSKNKLFYVECLACTVSIPCVCNEGQLQAAVCVLAMGTELWFLTAEPSPHPTGVYFSRKTFWGRRDGSVVKDLGCCSRGPEFGS